MSDHSCYGGNSDISFWQDGTVTYRFRRLCNGEYWGGGTQQGFPAYMTCTLDWMLRKVAELANDPSPASYHELQGHGWRTPITKRMDADRIAGPLACTENEVRRFFNLSVEIPLPPIAQGND